MNILVYKFNVCNLKKILEQPIRMHLHIQPLCNKKKTCIFYKILVLYKMKDFRTKLELR